MTTGPWLCADSRPLAPLEVPAGHRGRARGLLGRASFDGALLLAPARSVHTFGMRFAIDVLLCTAALELVEVVTVPPGRLVRARRGVRAVIEVAAGSSERWQLEPGCQLSVVAGELGE